MKQNIIVIVEDDQDDCDMLTEYIIDASIKNKLRCFNSALLALEYLKTTVEIPQLIISDINMPVMNGLEFKREINEDKKLSSKKIPFIFLSTSAQPHTLTKAVSLCIQGYFKKSANIEEFKTTVKSITDYWWKSELPVSHC